MAASKTIKALSSLTREEVEDFERFIDSPYFKRQRNLKPFFKILKNYYPDFKEDLSAGEIYSKLYPGKNADKESAANFVKTLSSELYSALREFLSYSGFKKDESRKQFYLLNALREKRLFSEFDKYYEAVIEKQNAEQGGSTQNYLNRYFIEHSYLEYSIEKNNFADVFNTISGLDEISLVIALIRAFRSEDIKLAAKQYPNACPGRNLVSVFLDRFDDKAFISDIKNIDKKYSKYLEINHLIYILSKFPDETGNYYKLRNAFFENIDIFSRDERYIIASCMASYCSRKITSEKNNIEFKREQFEIHKKSFELGFHTYSDKDYLQPVHFRNILLSALDLNETQWAEDFIEKFMTELNPEGREFMKQYCNAILNFHKKNYDSALENMAKIKDEFFFSKIDRKVLLFRIHYELGNYEQAFYAVESLRHYLSNAKDISEKSREKNTNLIKFGNELLKLKTNPERKDMNFLKEKICNAEFVAAREWLIEKICDNQ